MAVSKDTTEHPFGVGNQAKSSQGAHGERVNFFGVKSKQEEAKNRIHTAKLMINDACDKCPPDGIYRHAPQQGVEQNGKNDNGSAHIKLRIHYLAFSKNQQR